MPEAVTEALQGGVTRAAEGVAEAVGANDGEEGTHLVNWSNTHECRPKRFAQPETVEELEAIVADAHAKGALTDAKIAASSQVCCVFMQRHQGCPDGCACHMAGEKLRVMGSGLSPNGLPFSDEGILSLALLDRSAAGLTPPCSAGCLGHCCGLRKLHGQGACKASPESMSMALQGEVRGPAAEARHSGGRHPRGAGAPFQKEMNMCLLWQNHALMAYIGLLSTHTAAHMLWEYSCAQMARTNRVSWLPGVTA